MKKILNTRQIKKRKLAQGEAPLSMLTAYDFQTAQMLDSTDLDLILVGDSLGNVILGYETTVEVTLNDMITFGSAVKRGSPNKFVIVDMPFGTYSSIESGLSNSISLFQKTKAQALKLEGAGPTIVKLIQEMTATGIPVMGHIGLTPQSVHQQGGYYTHGKSKQREEQLISEARALEEAGCFSIVLECIEPALAKKITRELSIPTIGIGSGTQTDGQVLVTNDLLMLGQSTPPAFCKPIANLFKLKQELINKYLGQLNPPHNEKLEPKVQ